MANSLIHSIFLWFYYIFSYFLSVFVSFDVFKNTAACVLFLFDLLLSFHVAAGWIEPLFSTPLHPLRLPYQPPGGASRVFIKSMVTRSPLARLSEEAVYCLHDDRVVRWQPLWGWQKTDECPADGWDGLLTPLFCPVLELLRLLAEPYLEACHVLAAHFRCETTPLLLNDDGSLDGPRWNCGHICVLWNVTATVAWKILSANGGA